MDSSGQYENGRYKQDYYRAHPTWNMMPQHQTKEQTNALVMNKKIMNILFERDAAIQERNNALTEKREALAARDEALQQRDKALAERDQALLERDNALAALQYRETSQNAHNFTGPTTAASETGKGKRKNESNKRIPAKPLKSPKKGNNKKVGEDLNQQVVASPGKKCRSEWDGQDIGLNLVSFDDTTMPVPVCTCTGTPHPCYKWGSGGWQSACCTTTLSQYPLPQMPNKRHSRMGGRKMSGNVFSRLLSRLAAEGHDISSVPVDLKDYWARHGTNRYITIK